MVACATPADDGFHVAWSRPAESDEIRADGRVALAFSEQHDVEACTTDTILLRAIDAESRAVLEIPLTLAPVEDAPFPYGFELGHPPLPADTPYALLVVGGDEGCTSVVGEPAPDFMVEFRVGATEP
jgi:hypothetical protein